MNCRTCPAVILLFLAGCSYVPFSGGKLEGNLVAAPADWTETASTEIIELETNPADPYSVKLWIVGLGSSLYVHAGANRAAWVEHIDVDSHVRLLIDDTLFELRAVRVETQDEFNTFSDAYESKYGNRPRNENVAEAYLFRLETRT
ncbi:MAG: hypothetical protein OES38_05900 [Gammaproteobacteria bacterium]|nr:hypothetical protein [Gammaproteobacteria bacterium]